METINNCRLCGDPLKDLFLDLGISPLANSYVHAERLQQSEPMYPLKTFVCNSCFLVQIEDYESPQHIFSDYAYFSSYSDSWLKHSKAYVDAMMTKYKINSSHQVIEIASNDGYLLQYFVDYKVPVLGIEPAVNVAAIAEERGVPTVVDFFGTKLASLLLEQGKSADLLLGNNVLAHVPNLNDFVAGMKMILKPTGLITMEFPHLMRLIEHVQFDTIYHEHYSYYSLQTVSQLFSKHGLTVFDVEHLPTHGGSLRIYAKHSENEQYHVSSAFDQTLADEQSFGITDLAMYATFKSRAVQVKRDIVSMCIAIKNRYETIVGYGAPAKGNTLLNYCGLDSDYIDYTVDRNPHKQGRYLPGSRIPIFSPERIKETKPNYVFIFPWNLKDEIISQTSFIRQWGGKWIIPVPKAIIID
ncbi:methyltransferase domain-containing protein [Paenibacillus sp. GSMTC-2017]|uniref:class I SAM-dependent methyltransferase n=1 Tax=Paenibacillus sp. GSMTC-2017 TaxID=2794350 RepID=UPI0018D6C2ED|nr:class I SAM-dependent methyltransferase [Paenibacillus sp. GSMTC-2017]MBH5320632.1 methyltransferase domain-containing protein [Paenibacillus sp. GSMTC-2017]